MALPATHFRFALAAARRFEIGDRHAYLSGTLYPDSRWLTGVDRTATHGRGCREIGFADSDFKLGWFVHCRCDAIQMRLVLARCPQFAALDDHTRWMQISVMKMIQDQLDVRHVDMHDCLEALDIIQTPNGEHADDVRRYYLNVREVYGGNSAPDIAGYRRLWLGVGLNAPVVSEMMELLRRKTADSAFRALAASLFDDMAAELNGPQ
jgi:hypothetical protein